VPVQAEIKWSNKKPTETAAEELSMSKTTVWIVLRKRLGFKPYHIQMVQQFRMKITGAGLISV
jgi:hypothetical protein